MTVLRPAHGRARLYQAHPRGAEARRARASGEFDYGLVVRAAVAGVAFAAFLFVLPFVGLIVGAAVGVDMAVVP